MANSTRYIRHIESYVGSSSSPTQQAASVDAIASLLKNDMLTLESLVREMEMYLTTTDSIIRARGILLLAELLTCLVSKPLEDATIRSLIGFFTERLVDSITFISGRLESVEWCTCWLLGVTEEERKCWYGWCTEALAVAQSYLQNVQVQSLGQRDRKICFELLGCLLDRYRDDVVPLDDVLIFGICESIDGEKDPQCLLLTFHIIEVLVRLFPDPSSPLESFAMDLFENLSCYFPIHFTHPKGEDGDVKKEELSRALMMVFASTPLFEPFAVPLLLEKLSSSLPSTKVESLKYLSYCTQKYGPDRMAKHVEALWSALKDEIYSSTHSVLSLESELLDGMSFQDNEIVTEALVLLQKVISQNNRLLLDLIVSDEDINTTVDAIHSFKGYSDISMQSKKRLHAVGRILSVSAKASIDSCNRVFESFFPRLMDALGISVQNPDEYVAVSSGCNFGATYLCIELLAACRALVVGSDELTTINVPAHETWCNMLCSFSCSLTKAFCSTLTGTDESSPNAYLHSGAVKGLQVLASFPAGFSPVSKSIYESILVQLMAIITLDFNKTSLWKLGLKVLVDIGSFVHKSRDSGKAQSFGAIVVEKIASLMISDDLNIPPSLKVEIISSIGMTGLNYMLRILQGLDKALSTSLSGVYVHGDVKLAETTISLLECYSSKVLPCTCERKHRKECGKHHEENRKYKFKTKSAFPIDPYVITYELFHRCVLLSQIRKFQGWWTSHQKSEGFDSIQGFEEVPLHFAVNIWDQIENSTSFSIDFQKEKLLLMAMVAMKHAVGICLEESQSLIVHKAFSILSSSTSFLVRESMSETTLMTVEGSQFNGFLCRDEWIISLFASVIIALRPQTHIANVKVILQLFLTTHLNGHVPSAQALGSIINKLPVKSNGMDSSKDFRLEEAMDMIFSSIGWSSCNTDPITKCSAAGCGNEIGIKNLRLSGKSSRLLYTHAIVGLAWIGKGLLMRGHEKVKDIIFIFLNCLLSNCGIGILPWKREDSAEQEMLYLMRSAADAFHILVSDSETCLNRRFHTTIRPLYKQHLFSIVSPVLLSSIVKADSTISRTMLYRAFAHVVSCTPLTASLSEAKKLIPMLLDGLSMLSEDILNKDIVYNVLLVLSGIITDKNGQEAVVENANIIVGRLIELISYPHMMLIRETAIQCLIAMSDLPYARIDPMRTQVLLSISKALDDPKRVVRQEAVRCRQAWASIASRSLHF